MKRIPCTVIQAAKQYDPEAVEFICSHYESYITNRCQRAYKDKQGVTRHYIDDDLYYKAKSAVFSAIEGFRFQEPPDNFMP